MSRPNEFLGVNRMGKNIKKSPIHQPNCVSNSSSSCGNNANATPPRTQPQPQVYNISKSDFRSMVQQLTGSPQHSQEPPRPPPPRPLSNHPKPQSNRLQRVRPPPLTPINRPPIPNIIPAPAPARIHPPMQGPPMPIAPHAQGQYHNNNTAGASQFGPPYSMGMQSLASADPHWAHPALSPISAYMLQLQSCINDPGGRPSPHPSFQQVPGQFQPQQQFQAGAQMEAQFQPPPPGPGLLHNPSMPPPIPSPRMNGPALLPSPTAQFLLPSPTMPSPSGFYNLLSPTFKSPYPLLSPGSQFPPPLSPNFSFAPMGQSGILGPAPSPGHQPPLSPSGFFSLSPSGFFPMSSPRWREM